MRVFLTVLIIAQAICLVSAASPGFLPNKVRWTLHRSCYMNDDFTAADDELKDGMIATVQQVKDWASRGAEKLDDSIRNRNTITEKALTPLLNKNGYGSSARYVRDKFKLIEKLEGPIGQNGDAGGKFDESDEWRRLEDDPLHHYDVIIRCRMNLIRMRHPILQTEVSYDPIRKSYAQRGQGLDLMQDQQDMEFIILSQMFPHPKAGTSKDIDLVVPRQRRSIPSAMSFHPSWLRENKRGKFNVVTQEWLDKMSTKDVTDSFKQQAVEMNDPKISPIQYILDMSLTKLAFHEMFHLGGMDALLDTPPGEAYGWANNKKNQNKDNADLMAIIAMVIELLNRDGQKYMVLEDGSLSKL